MIKLKKHIAVCCVAFSLIPIGTKAQELTTTCKELATYLTQVGRREASIGRIGIDTVLTENDTLKFFATDNCAYIPFTETNVKEIYSKLRSIISQVYEKNSLCIYTQEHAIEDFVPLAMRSKRNKHTSVFTRPETTPLVTNASAVYVPTRGLAGRHISIWASHGRYYEPKLTRWEWQRARLFQTVEDLYTRSYVMPFLVPMLENAGAYVLLPRERDVQTEEIVVDNDGGINSESLYSESVGDFGWKQGDEVGFAHYRSEYKDFENPFKEGTFRFTQTIKKGKASIASWKPYFKKSGLYAVYVSYHSMPNSAEDALYTVYHKGGTTQKH